MTHPLLQLSQITKAFGAVQALRGVSFALAAGEVHALVGENGAGKSTLIKIITGAHAPDHGTILICGQSANALTPAAARRLGVAAIYQQPALFPDLSVAENIALRLEPPHACHRVNWLRRRDQAASLLARIGADINPDRGADTLSMPQQQLVEIACAVGGGARIVIMDEPTACLSAPEQKRLFTIVRDLRDSGVGVIYISHRLDEIFALADRITVLRDGETVAMHRLRAAGPATGEATRAVTEAEIIREMIGRERSAVYPSAPPAAAAIARPVVLALRNLGCLATGVQRVNLEVRAGEIVGFAGLVGAGRTELARVLFGITPADQGELWFDGQPLVVASPAQAIEQGIAYLPEDRRRHGLIGELPLGANLTLAIHRRIFPRGWLRLAAERDLARRYISELDIRASGPEALGASLSGGNQQKVMLARWLAMEPKLLILDEPTQGVDVGAKAEIHRFIRDLAAKGISILLISSDLPEVLGMSDRVAVMRAGTIVEILDAGAATADRVMTTALTF
jgi:rhamnose transport system ATP-binding protein